MGAEELRPVLPPLRLEALLRLSGYRRLGEVDPAILDAGRLTLERARELIEPRIFHIRREVDRIEPGGLTLAGGPIFHGSCFARQLGSCSHVVAFVLTLGGALEERSSALMESHEVLDGFLLDGAATLALALALNHFRRMLAAREAVHGLGLSARLGPGYADWPLPEQRELFSLFAGSDLPVALNDSFVMVPAKSMSGLFGCRRR